MANPQLENGHTRIANEIIEALCKVKLPSEAMRIFLAIVRLTYGWNRKEAVIRNFELVDITGIERRNINRAILKLTTTKMLFVIKPDDKSYPKYCINKNYEQWESVIKPDDLSSNQMTSVIKPDDNMSSNQMTSTPMKPIQGNGYSDPKDSKDIKDNIYVIFFEKFWKIYPDRKGKKLGKTETFEAIKRTIKPDEFDELLKALQNYANSDEVKNGYAKDPKRFIKNQNWNWRDWLQVDEKPQTKGMLWV